MAYEKFLKYDGSIPSIGGSRKVYEFPNGLGASVISHAYSYGGDLGLWELAVLSNGNLNYNTPITSDVEGHLTWEDVETLLRKISELPEGVY